jgi:hypothetical protein
MDFENLYKLVTHENRSYIHKTLSILSFSIYFYRLYLLLIYNDMNVNIPTLVIHGTLNISSFMFRISSTRHGSMPIISPEFRMHNLLFVVRSILCCLCFYYNLHVIANMFICFGTMAIADAVSAYYRSNTTTRRLTPSYMNHLEDHEKNKVIRMHSFMQLVATYYMLENMNTAYSPIFAIQISAFLMTLAKEGIIDVVSWHYLYSLALWLNILCVLNTNISYFFEMNLLCHFMYYWRICNGMNKYIGWLITFGMHYLFKNSIIMYIDAYVNTWDIYYIYLYKYAIISYVINYFHLQFEKELVLPFFDSV